MQVTNHRYTLAASESEPQVVSLDGCRLFFERAPDFVYIGLSNFFFFSSKGLYQVDLKKTCSIDSPFHLWITKEVPIGYVYVDSMEARHEKSD